MRPKGVIERLIAAGLTRKQAEVALLIADGATMPDLKEALGPWAVQEARFMRREIGPNSQIKALVEVCWKLVAIERFEKKLEEEGKNGHPGQNAAGIS
jgi:hypothetical protein